MKVSTNRVTPDTSLTAKIYGSTVGLCDRIEHMTRVLSERVDRLAGERPEGEDKGLLGKHGGGMLYQIDSAVVAAHDRLNELMEQIERLEGL